jgi:hypothetical protein
MSRARKEESQHALFFFFFLLSSLTTPRRVPFVSRRCSSGRMVAPNPRGSCRYARTHVDLSTSPVQPISNSSSVTSLAVCAPYGGTDRANLGVNVRLLPN